MWLTTSPDGLLDQVTWRTGDAALRELDRGNEKVDQAYREIEAGYLDAADSLHWYHVLIHPDHEVGPFKREGGGAGSRGSCSTSSSATAGARG
ncbi:hypothetical protein ACFSTC_22005 [Nonomuraea ferruginea]